MKSVSRHRRARPARSAWSDEAAGRRVDRRRRRRDGRTRRVLASAGIALATGMAAFLGAAVATGHLGGGSSVPAATIAGEPVSSTAQTVRDERGAAADPGTVGGTLRVVTPVSGGDIRVTYVVEGARTVVQVADSAPYELVLDTRTLPNGPYTVKQVVFRGQAPPQLITTSLVVRNPSVGVLRATAGPSVFPAVSPPATAATAATAVTAGARPPTPSAAAGTVVPVTRPSLAPVPVMPVGPTVPLPVAQAPLVPGLSAAAAIRLEVISLTNIERAKVGCPALILDLRLAGAAQEHSQDMAAHNYFDHNSLDGRTAFERITDAGYAYSAAAENIAAGQQTPAAVMAGWMNSPGHRANILNCSLTQIGVGYAIGGSYGFYWTQDFGTP
jgi:uncharacterized protein YkwD